MRKTNNLFKTYLTFTAFLFSVFISVFLLGGCGDSPVEPPVNGGGTTSTTVAGIVVNENREPIVGATVTVHGNTAQTGAGGEFIFNNITVPAERLFVNVTAAGYFNGTKGEVPNSGDITQLRITMMQKTVTHTINSTTGGTANLSNGSEVIINANSLVDQNNSQYNGSVSMSVVYMDPTSNSFSETVQGGDMAALRSDSSSATLLSYGVLKVIMEGSGGQPLQLSAGSTSQITSTIPASMVSSAPSTIPLWFFDESTGLWREDGSAVKQGDKYVGTVSHFTDWNCDYPGTTGSITGRVLDCSGQPLPGITVKVGQVTTVTNAAGNYTRNVPAGISFMVSIEASQNFGISAAPVSVGPVPAGNTQNLPDFNVACYPVITGNFKDCNGGQLTGMVSAKWDNQIQTAVPNTSAGFRMTVAPNKTATLRFVSSTGQIKDTVIQTPAAPVTLDMGEIRLCTGVSQGENSFTINGAGFNNVFVNLNASVAIGIYYISENETALSSVAQNGDFLALFFPGNTTGPFSMQNGNIKYNNIIFTADETISGNVTTYENVGGLIEGTFSGTFESSEGTATISGRFFVTRQPDKN